MKKLSDILNESVWADMHKRSNGETVRKEDICKTVVIDGVKYFIMKDFWGMGEQYKEETGDDWVAFAFNKMPDGSKAISGDTDAAGVFGKDKWDIGTAHEYDVYVLKDYLTMTKNELVERAYDSEDLYNDFHWAQSITKKYIEDVFEHHMSDYAEFWVTELTDTVFSKNMVINVYEGTDLAELEVVKKEFGDKEFDNAVCYLYPTFDKWYKELEKELTEAYEVNGWVKSKTFEVDYTVVPGGTTGICFVKFDEDDDNDEDKGLPF